MPPAKPPLPLDEAALRQAVGGSRRGAGPSGDFVRHGPGGAGFDPFAGNDLIFGTEGGDSIAAGRGDDRIFAEGGDDVIRWSAGDGNDTVDGGAGRDTLSLPAAYLDSLTIHAPDGTQLWDGRYAPAPGGGYAVELPATSGYLLLRDPANPEAAPVRIEFANLERLELR